MADTPYIGFGNDTLDDLPELRSGDMIVCPRCSSVHEVSGGKDEAGNPTDILLFYKCGGKTYLAGVAGRCVAGVKPDVSGRADL